MAAVAATVHPFPGGVPRGAAPAPSDASKRASGKKPRRVVAPARDSSVCLAGGVEEFSYLPTQKRKMMTCNRSNVFETAHTAAAAADTKVLTVGGGGEMSARELLQKRLACELDVLRGLLKTAELISRCAGPCKGGGAPPTAGKKERLLASKQLPEPMVDGGGGNAPPVKRTKISALVEQKQKRVRAPRMSPEERSQLAGRVSSLSEELPGHIAEFLLKHFGDADSHGEIEIDFDSAEDSVLFELKAQLDKFAQERRPNVVDVLPEEEDEKIAVESKSKGILVEQEVKTGSRPSSRNSSDSYTYGDSACERYSDEFPAPREALPEQIIATPAQPPSSKPPASGAAAQSGEAKKVQDVQRAAPKTAVSLAGLIYRAKVRRELLEMERAALPDESIHPWDLQRLGIAEYGRPSIMRQLGLFLKADDA